MVMTMLRPMVCPDCASENALAGRYCMNCGSLLMAACVVCGDESPRESRFCRTCGAERSTAVAGLLLERALSWSEQFETIGWKDWAQYSEKERELIKSAGLPSGDTEAKRLEPYIFDCYANGDKWKIKKVEVRGKLSTNRACVSATRCRLAIAAEKQNYVGAWWHRDLQG